MRGTLVFVHGAGVRGAGLDRRVESIRSGLARNDLAGIELRYSAWGDTAGVKVGDIDATLPTPPPTRAGAGPEEVGAADREAARWAMLLDDPLLELRVAGRAAGGGAGGATSAAVVVGELRADQQARDLILALSVPSGALEKSELTAAEVRVAARSVADSPELAAAALAVPPSDPELLEAAARAIVATALAAHRFDPPGQAPVAAMDPAARDALVEATFEALSPDATRGAIGDFVKRSVGGFVARQATKIGLARRNSIMGLHAWTIADVLSYQRRSDMILDVIRGDLAAATGAATGPVVAVGHSLGGIALVDLLSRLDRPQVDLLVTVGSQSPMLYAFDALGTLRLRQPGAPFTPWLNIYSPQDFVSFVAGPIFGGAPGITDVPLELELPFPESHDGYWYDDRVYRTIADAWPAAGR
jgi:hypothetical protein